MNELITELNKFKELHREEMDKHLTDYFNTGEKSSHDHNLLHCGAVYAATCILNFIERQGV